VSNGIEFITKETGLNILAKLLQRSCGGIEKGSAQVAVLLIDWRNLLKSNPRVARMPLVANIAEEQAGEIHAQAEPGLTKAALLEADPEERHGLLESYLAEQVARELMIPLPELNITQPLPMLGFDSLMAVRVKNQIESDLSIVLPVVEFLQDHSVAMLAYILQRNIDSNSQDATLVPEITTKEAVDAALNAATDIDPEHALYLLGKIDELTDDQVNAILKKIAPTRVEEVND
jgi:acyl carrier protein